jgi:glyoxylase-like metal-dependent hydrolase (beta-lactamase superfamily II)
MTVRLFGMTCGFVTMPLDAMVPNAPGMIKAPIECFLIEHPRGRIVFDSGLRPSAQHHDFAVRQRELGALGQVATAIDFEVGHDVAGRLETFGLDPGKIDFLISSHLHVDHTGGNALLPNARWIIQRREWAAGCDADCQAHLNFDASLYDLGHDRIEPDGEYDVFDDGSVVCIPTYGHTPGHQSVRIRLDGRDVILTADACYMRQNLEQMSAVPIDAAQDMEDMLNSFRRIRAFRDAGAFLIYGHDADLWRQISDGPMREITCETLSNGLGHPGLRSL